MVNPALVMAIVNIATTMLNSTESPIITPTTTNNAYRNEDTGVVGNLLITRRDNYTHLTDCDDKMDYCDFAMDPPTQSMHILRSQTLARCDPLIFMHNYEYLDTPVMKIIVHNRD